MERDQLLDRIAALSREFGGTRYVHGGGGNTSVKEDGLLWVKPSGCTLAGLTPVDFIGLDRSRLAPLYGPLPADAAAREAAARHVLSEAVVSGGGGRPSVETPLHDSIAARFIVHTHPTLVNGLTCAADGRAAAARLFPDALWIDYVDPGCLLARRVRAELEGRSRGSQDDPAVIFLQNHGVFVGGGDPGAVRTAYARIMDRLAGEYVRLGLAIPSLDAPAEGPDSDPAAGVEDHGAGARRRILDLLSESWTGPAAPCVVDGAGFIPATGPLTPDHIVYAGSEPLAGDPIPAAVDAYRGRFGYYPKVITAGGRVFGVGDTPGRAALALELAQAGAAIVHLAGAFGGVRYLDPEASRFIEGWEVERYRMKQI